MLPCLRSFPLSWHLIVESLEVQHCLNPQYDSLFQSPGANIVMAWSEGKLDAIPLYAVMKVHHASVLHAIKPISSLPE